MRKFLLACLVTAVVGSFGFAAEQTLTGKISDSMCGATHKKMAEHGKANISDRECTLACVKAGGKYVLVSDGKVYNIENQDYAGLREHAGHTVRVTGDVNGDTIKVSSMHITGAKTSKTEKSST